MHSDVELQVLALQTLLRIEEDLVEASPDVLVGLRGDLSRLAAQGAGDSRFFARQCLDHIDHVRARAAREAMSGPGAPAAGPPPVVQRLTQRLRANPPLPLDTDSLARVAGEKRREARPGVLGILGSDTDAETVATALAALGAIGETADAAVAAPFLRHRDARVRANAVEVVEALAPRERQVALLAGLAGDPEDRVRANVLKALGALGTETIFAGLSEMLASHAIGTRASAVYALRHVRGDRAIELLWKAARDPSELIRLRGVEALRGNRHPQASEMLRKLCNDIDISIAEAAYASLAELAVAESAAAPMESLASAAPEVQIRALKEIQSAKKRDARDAVLQVMGATADPVVLAQALSALAVIGTPEDAPAVLRLLGHANDRARASAVETVAALAPNPAVVKWLTPMLDDPHNRVRGNVIRALAERGVTGLESKVELMLRHNEVPMRLSGAWCAAFIEAAAALRLLARAARDADPDVRRMVVESLGKLPAGPEIAQLGRELAADTVVATSEAARALLQRIGGGHLTSPPPRTTLRMHVSLENLEAEAGSGLPPPPARGSEAGAGPQSRPSARTMNLELPELEGEVSHAPNAASRRRATSARLPVARAGAETAGEERPGGSVDALYEQLDEELEAMGRKLYQLQEQNVISDPVFSKINYQIKRHADLLRKREEASRSGFLSRLPFFRTAEKDPAVLQLEFNLGEEYRRLGERAIELYHGVERSFPSVQDHYDRVESLLRRVKELKEKTTGDGD